MITGIIIGILIWQVVILILALTDKLNSDTGTLFASGIFGLITVGILSIYRTIHRRLICYNINKHFVMAILMKDKLPIQSFYVPIKEIDLFCNDDTKKYYIKVAPANAKNHVDKNDILTLSKIRTGFNGWTSEFLKNFLR